jgi:hypothetical protein
MRFARFLSEAPVGNGLTSRIEETVNDWLKEQCEDLKKIEGVGSMGPVDVSPAHHYRLQDGVFEYSDLPKINFSYKDHHCFVYFTEFNLRGHIQVNHHFLYGLHDDPKSLDHEDKREKIPKDKKKTVSFAIAYAHGDPYQILKKQLDEILEKEGA